MNLEDYKEAAGIKIGKLMLVKYDEVDFENDFSSVEKEIWNMSLHEANGFLLYYSENKTLKEIQELYDFLNGSRFQRPPFYKKLDYKEKLANCIKFSCIDYLRDKAALII